MDDVKKCKQAKNFLGKKGAEGQVRGFMPIPRRAFSHLQTTGPCLGRRKEGKWVIIDPYERPFYPAWEGHPNDWWRNVVSSAGCRTLAGLCQEKKAEEPGRKEGKSGNW